jgi:integrase
MGQSTARTIKFTALGLSRIKTPKRREFYTEDVGTADRRGLKLCVEPTGTKRFVARVHVAGDIIDGRRAYKARDITLGTLGEIDVEEAHRRLERVRAAITAGKEPTPFVVRAAKPVRRKNRRRREISPLFDRTPDGAIPAPPAGAHSVELLAYEFYWEFLVKERKTPDYVKRILDADIVPQWRGRDARTVTPREIVLFLRGIAERAPVMANRVAATLSQMFRFGIEMGIVDDTPYKLLRKPGGKEKARQRVLTDSELRQFWRALDGDKIKMSYAIRHALRILTLTGARRGEIASARWEHISETLWVVPASASKTGHPHSFPLTGATRAQFELLRKLAKGSTFVMPSPVPGISLDPHAITTALRRSQSGFGIDAFTVHDLRRTMRTGLSALGVSSEMAERTIGHLVGSDIQRTYDVHSFEKERREALQKWADHVAAVLATKDVQS